MALMKVALVMWLLAVSVSPTSIAPRRIIHVRERQELSLCRYDVVVDDDPNRIPDRIEKVLCREDGCKCVQTGDFRCTQLYTKLNVSYGDVEFDVLDVEQTCVCARVVGGDYLEIISGDIV